MFNFKSKLNTIGNKIQNYIFINYSMSHFNLLSTILKSNKPGDQIQIKGWVKSLRDQKNNVFFDVSDGSTSHQLQVLISKDIKPTNLSVGASIGASGKLTLSPNGHLELVANKLEVIGECKISDGYPFAPRKQYEPEYVRQHLHFRPKTNKFSALLRIRNLASLNIHKYLNEKQFINVHTPIITSNDCEGAGEVFKVVPESDLVIKSMQRPELNSDEVYFNKKVFLTVSGQLHLEAAAHSLSKVYTFGPTFRAENSRSRFHLSEFYMLEAEIAYMNELQSLIDIIEDLVKTVTRNLLEVSSKDIETCQETKDSFLWLDKKFCVLSYAEVCEILKANQDKYTEQFCESEGLCKAHEIFIVKHCGNVPTFVIDWPKEMKPFYMKCKGNVAFALDLLAPNVGEVVGGSLREDDYETLINKIPTKNRHHLKWYLELRKFGGVSTGGFGLGFDRYIQSILGIANIKDVIPFPRWPHNCNL